MSLPVRQQRILDEIGDSLRDCDPHLTSLFVIFGRLNNGETMPSTEEIEPLPAAARIAAAATSVWRRPVARARVLLLLPAALTAMICAIVITLPLPGTHRSTPAKAPATHQIDVKPRKCHLITLHLPAYNCLPGM